MKASAPKAINPFSALFQAPPVRLPKTASQQIVSQGKRIGKAAQLKRQEDIDLAALRRERERAYQQQRYQRERQDPAAMARRKAWHEANLDKVREYKREWDAKNAARQREYKAEWARRKYHASPEAAERARQATRDYYARNREKILARIAEKAAAKKAAKQAAAAPTVRAAEPAPAAPPAMPLPARKRAPGQSKSPWHRFGSLGELSRKGGNAP